MAQVIVAKLDAETRREPMNETDACLIHAPESVCVFCVCVLVRPQPYPVIYAVANPVHDLLDRNI